MNPVGFKINQKVQASAVNPRPRYWLLSKSSLSLLFKYLENNTWNYILSCHMWHTWPWDTSELFQLVAETFDQWGASFSRILILLHGSAGSCNKAYVDINAMNWHESFDLFLEYVTFLYPPLEISWFIIFHLVTHFWAPSRYKCITNEGPSNKDRSKPI